MSSGSSRGAVAEGRLEPARDCGPPSSGSSHGASADVRLEPERAIGMSSGSSHGAVAAGGLEAPGAAGKFVGLGRLRPEALLEEGGALVAPSVAFTEFSCAEEEESSSQGADGLERKALPVFSAFPAVLRTERAVLAVVLVAPSEESTVLVEPGARVDCPERLDGRLLLLPLAPRGRASASAPCSSSPAAAFESAFGSPLPLPLDFLFALATATVASD